MPDVLTARSPEGYAQPGLSNFQDDLLRIRQDVASIKLGKDAASSSLDLKQALTTNMDGDKAVAISKNIPGTQLKFDDHGQPTSFTFGKAPTEPVVKVDLKHDTVNGKSDQQLRLDLSADDLYKQIKTWDKQDPEPTLTARQGLGMLAAMGDKTAGSVLDKLVVDKDADAQTIQTNVSERVKSGNLLDAKTAAEWLMFNNREQMIRHDLGDLLYLGQGGDRFATNVETELQNLGAIVKWNGTYAQSIDLHGVGKK